MRSAVGVLTLAGLFAGPAAADDSCRSAGDGACDELERCALGTDATDCAAACAPPWPRDLDGPCAHLAAVAARASPPPPDALGSHGEGGPRGFWAGTVVARGNTPFEDLVRHFEVYVPETYDARVPTPVIFMLAGFTVDMYGLAAYTELVRTADLNGFVVVFPQQHYYDFGRDLGWVFAWNVYRTDWIGGEWSENPDVDFIRVLAEELKGLYNVDRTRIFSSGHSRGAAMSIILAFTLTDLVAGFVSEMGFIEPNGFDVEVRAYAGGRRIPGALVAGVEDLDVVVGHADFIDQVLTEEGWAQGEDYLFYRLESVAHEWQPQYNQEIWDFMVERPLPIEQAAP